MTAETAIVATAVGDRSASMLVLVRGDRHFCCPFNDVEEILEAPRLLDPGVSSPLLAAVLLHEGQLIPAVDPAFVVEQPIRRAGMAVLLRGAGRQVALLADTVLGFRVPVSLGPAPWVPDGRMCRQMALFDPWGQAFVLGADGFADVPAVPGPAAVAGIPASGPGARMADGGGRTRTCLTFTVAGRDYAASYADIQRILYRQPLFRIPGGEVPLRYAVDVNGAIVPVLELVLSVDPPSSDGGNAGHPLACLIVLHSPQGGVALRVDEVGRPLPLTADPTDVAWFPSPGVAGIARHDDHPYSLINGAALVRDLLDDGDKGGNDGAERGTA